jgi:hypothetical protein
MRRAAAEPARASGIYFRGRLFCAGIGSELMSKSTLLLTIVTTALGLGAVYLYREHAALTQAVELERNRCAQQVEQLRNDYRAQIAELQRYMMQ